VNVTPGQTRPNQVIVPIGRDGRVEVYNDLGSTDVVVDVQGYYSAVNGPHGSGYHPSTPTRFMDTRMPGSTVLGPGEARTLYVGIIGAEAGQISAVDVNLTVTAPTAAGHLTAWSGQDPAPHASNVNFAPGQTVANHAVVPVTYNERGRPVITLRNSAGLSHVVVDVLGWYDQGTSNDGLRFRPVSTTRLMDTRATQQRLQRDEARTIPGALLPNALGHVVNATATASTGAGHLTAWDGNGAPPGTSTLNFNIGEDSANLATPAVGPDGALAFVSGGSAVHLVVDQLGYFY
jgi:serine protease